MNNKIKQHLYATSSIKLEKISLTARLPIKKEEFSTIIKNNSEFFIDEQGGSIGKDIIFTLQSHILGGAVESFLIHEPKTKWDILKLNFIPKFLVRLFKPVLYSTTQYNMREVFPMLNLALPKEERYVSFYYMENQEQFEKLKQLNKNRK